MIQNGGIQKNLKSKTQSADSNLRPRREASGKTKDLPTLTLRFEARNETRNLPRGERRVWMGRNSATLTKFGAFVNALSNFSTKMGGEKPVLGQLV
ncbi:hypothetical protein AVEN_121912-1 [Araneus ventricosus]|uniref:Uncharacterized protein n=1 Tax=Araneus ventricosus TaxID=182803 RepID=A0A4Y2J6G9_ARAVE|nr:hypothetical protein AVEN_121912-1 [Araneus ventricosus]